MKTRIRSLCCSRPFALLCASFLGTLQLFAGAQPAPAGPLDPVKARTQLLYRQIYDATAWAKRVPYALAMPIVVRARLGDWVEGLELEADVRKRVVARIESKTLVDEIIPFLMTVKDTYSVDDEGVDSFDEVLRSRYSSGEEIAGMEHSMFRWQTASPEQEREPDGGFAIDDASASRIVTLYDALYLRRVKPDAKLAEELASCQRREDLAELRAAVDVTMPIARELIEDVRNRLKLEGEMAAAVEAVLEDPKRLQTVTAASISFIDRLVCRSYRKFATRLGREQQLRHWLHREFDEPDGRALWNYLRHAEHERRYGVLVVVDGLQGSLMEALVNGPNQRPFLNAVRSLHAHSSSLAPKLPDLRSAPSQQIHFLEALSSHEFRDPRYLPFFRDLYRDDGPEDPRRPLGLAVGGIATTPTISVRNLPISWTGAPVAGSGGSGIPNFHFVDRSFQRDGVVTGRPYYFYGNDAMQLLPLTRETGMRSLFDRMPRHGSFSCAAQYDEAAHYSIDAFLNLALGEAQRDFAELLCMTELQLRANNERRLRKLRRALLRDRDELVREVPFWRVFSRVERRDRRKLARRRLNEIARLEQRALPELLVYYNPWPDHFAHFTGPFSDEIIAPSGELARLDYWMGVLTDFYAEAGVETRTVFGMAGDHGLSPIFHFLNPEVVVFDALRTEGIDFRVAKISSDEGEGPKLNNIFDPPEMKGYDVVVASTAGGNYMLDFFRDQAELWAQQPLYEHLRSLQLIQPSADTGQPQPAVDVIAALIDRLADSLDYLVVREEACDAAGGVVRVVSSPGGVRNDSWIERRGDRIAYRFDGADLLGTDRLTPYRSLSADDRARHGQLRESCLEASLQKLPEAWCNEAEWRELASYTARPDSVAQLAHLYDSDRAGSVNLFPREGVGYNTKVPGRHAGESFYEKDAFAGLWGLPVTGAGAADRIRTLLNGQVPAAIFEYLSGKATAEGQDGFGYPSVGADLFPASLQSD